MQFIYQNKEALSPFICKELINKFEDSPYKQEGGISRGGQHTVDKKYKASTDMAFDPSFLQDPEWGSVLSHVINVLELGLQHYKFKFYESISGMQPLKIDTLFNIQRYTPGEAYHNYHYERGGKETAYRSLVWLIYLNTLTDGGETQFYYQDHKEKPEEGKLIIWPSDWTHMHRGLSSLTQTKYIITGWFNYNEWN